jgi:hypothetical protein
MTRELQRQRQIKIGAEYCPCGTYYELRTKKRVVIKYVTIYSTNWRG